MRRTRWIAAVGSVATLLTTMTTVALAPVADAAYHTACDRTDQAPGAFPDAGLAADCLKAYGVALGKADGTFGEADDLLRSQVSSLLARFVYISGVDLSARRTFPDVNASTVPDSNVRDEIEMLAGSGVIAGFPDGTFGPGGKLTVAQAATFVVRSMQLIHSVQPSRSPDIRDQGSTGANWSYAESVGILDPTATYSQSGAQYHSEMGDTTVRGLIADMLAQSLELLNNRYFANCQEAANFHVTPIYRGQPGYRPALDPNGNSIACEPGE
jgi:hypothetical protein